MFPFLAAFVSLLITLVMLNQYRTRKRPYQAVWSIAFALFTAGTAAEWIGANWGWSPLTIRVFYLAGAILTTGYLALGLVWLQWGAKTARVATWLVGVLTLLAAISIGLAPIDEALMAELGWEAMTRPPLARGIGLFFNIAGTLLLVGGTLWSAWSMRGKPFLRNRALGIFVLTLGVMVVAAGGSMVGVLSLSKADTLAVTNALGAVLMLTGILIADQPVRSQTKVQAGTS